MEEQLDDISDWLESRVATPMLKKTSGVTRISVAIMQGERSLSMLLCGD
jgi:hypothetical protein